MPLCLLLPVIACFHACVASEPVAERNPRDQSDTQSQPTTRFDQPLQSLMTAGSIGTTFANVESVAFLTPDPEAIVHEAGAWPEHTLLEMAIRDAVRARFQRAGYRWEDSGQPQRTIQIGFLLTPELTMDDIDELYRLVPGFLGPESAERGVIALAFSWPGRAEPVCRVVLDGVVSPDATIEDRLAAIGPAIEAMLADLPQDPGSLEEPMVNAEHGVPTSL